MKNIFLISISILVSFQSFSQCNWQWHDSIRHNKDWAAVKQLFIPVDLDKYSLVLEDLTDEQQSINEKRIQENYYAVHDKDSLTGCEHLNGNVAIEHDDEKIKERFKKYFKGSYKIVNIDSIKFLPIEKYPYVLMYYSEVSDLDKDGISPLIGRVGYYIWDRRTNFRYPVYSCLGPKEDKVFFTNLNQ